MRQTGHQEPVARRAKARDFGNKGLDALILCYGSDDNILIDEATTVLGQVLLYPNSSGTYISSYVTCRVARDSRNGASHARGGSKIIDESADGKVAPTGEDQS